MAFMGGTDEVGLAELLSVLAHRRHTGRLTIISEGEEAQIFLEDGLVVSITSSNHALRLGRILVRLGIVTAEQLEHALREQNAQAGKRPLGEILVAAGVVTADDLARAAEEQCIEVLTRVMVSRQGTFVFSRDARPPAKQGLVALKTDRIVLEASRRADEMVTLRSLLPAADATLSLTATAVTDPALTGVERQVIDAIAAGTRTLEDLARDATVDEVSLWRTVVSLIERDVISAEADVASAAAEPPESVPARPLAEVIRLCAEGSAMLTSRVPTLAEVRAGMAAGPQTVAAVTAVIREVIAAFNAGLVLRAFASFSDDHFRRRGPLPAEEIAALRVPGYPLRVEEQEMFIGLQDVRLLVDGRVSAILSTHVPRVGETKKVLIFARRGDQWQIDAVIESPQPHLTPTSQAAMFA